MEPISLLELNHIIRDTLDSELPPAYWVMAEIGELRLNPRGHCYLEFIEKKDDRLVAKTRATIWASTWRTLNHLFQQVTGKPLGPGMKVLAQVTVQYHELYGMSLNVRNIDPSFTVGESARKRQEVINQLQEDGVFSMNKQLELPLAPQRIAVISSPTAAGLGDFANQLLHNSYGFLFSPRLYKAVMQGETAEESILQALMQIYAAQEDFDLVVIIRGGGAKADLDCFDRYNLASHLAQFPLPVLTGIGHDRDETICDLVAHTGLKTPTAVAEFLINRLRLLEERIEGYAETIVANVQYRQQEAHNSLQQLSQRLRHVTSMLLGSQRQQLKHTASRILQASQHSTQKSYRQLVQLQRHLPISINNALKIQDRRLNFLEKELSLIDPKGVLARGYSIARYQGKAIHYQLPPVGASIEIATAAGTIQSNVENIQPNEQ